MKSKIDFKSIIASFLFFVCSNSMAQTNFRWADSASVWHYSYYYGYGGGFQKIKNMGDTTIAGIPCQRLHFYQETKTLIAPGIFSLTIDSTSVADRYVYKSNDSVFYSKNNNFHLAFKTNAQVGEIWDVSSSPDKVFVRVDSVYFNNYNGISLRNILVTPCDSGGNTIAFSSDSSYHNNITLLKLINEKFGPMNGFNVIGNYFPQNFVNCALPENLLCFESSLFPSYVANSSTNCENNISLSYASSKPTSELVQLYPNPVNDILHIVIPQNHNVEDHRYQIFSPLGTLVMQGQLNENGIIDTQLLLHQSVYFVIISSKKSTYQKFFIKN